MEIDSQQVGAVAVLKPGGPVIAAEADQLKAQLLESVTANLGRVVLDASGVPFVDSRGLEVLVEVSDTLADGGRVLKLAGIGETLREVLSVTDLISMFEHYEDVGSAVRSFL